MLQEYIKEIKYLKLYIISIPVVIIASYSVYFFLDVAAIKDLTKEDHLFENATAVCFFIASVFLFLFYKKNKNIFLLLLALLLFFAFGEEISWGQRIFNFDGPRFLWKTNVQQEFNIHNREMFDHYNLDHTEKTGWHRLLEINFLLKTFCFLFGFLLPICTFHLKSISKIVLNLKLPVPPIAIGSFFIFSWLAYRFILTLISTGRDAEYYRSAGEIFEFLISYVFAVISIYFYNKRKENILGLDVKQYINKDFNFPYSKIRVNKVRNRFSLIANRFFS